MAVENLEQTCERKSLPHVVLFFKSSFPSEEEKEEIRKAKELLREEGFLVNTIPVNRIVDSFYDVPVQAEFNGLPSVNGLNAITKVVQDYRDTYNLIRTLPLTDFEKVKKYVEEQYQNQQI